jgi:hypothetical protein
MDISPQHISHVIRGLVVQDTEVAGAIALDPSPGDFGILYDQTSDDMTDMLGGYIHAGYWETSIFIKEWMNRSKRRLCYRKVYWRENWHSIWRYMEGASEKRAAIALDPSPGDFGILYDQTSDDMTDIIARCTDEKTGIVSGVTCVTIPIYIYTFVREILA